MQNILKNYFILYYFARYNIWAAQNLTGVHFFCYHRVAIKKSQLRLSLEIGCKEYRLLEEPINILLYNR